jgi:hypothetical protein
MAGESEEQAAARTQSFLQSVYEMPVNPSAPEGERVTKAKKNGGGNNGERRR